MSDRVSQSGKESEQEKLNKSKKKRIRRKQNRIKTSTLKFVGNNADGLLNKLESLEHFLKENPSVFFIQQTQLQRPGRIKTPTANKYTWYELHRTVKASKGEKGGGIGVIMLVRVQKLAIIIQSLNDWVPKWENRTNMTFGTLQIK